MEIKQAVYLVSSPDYEKCPAADRPEYAFIGRSNVGKSSLINMLVNNNSLAKTSGTPGKTQLINHFDISSITSDKVPVYQRWYIVDLPGYGFAKVSHSSRNRWEQMIDNYLRKRPNLVHVFVLIDSRHSPQKIDLDFVNNLDKWEVPFSFIFTKTDKENQSVVAKNVRQFLDKLRASWQFLPAHFLSSAVKKSGRDKILSLIEEMNKSFYSRAE
jgi:GTP-binding protein